METDLNIAKQKLDNYVKRKEIREGDTKAFVIVEVNKTPGQKDTAAGNYAAIPIDYAKQINLKEEDFLYTKEVER